MAHCADEELAKRLQDEEIERAQGSSQPGRSSAVSKGHTPDYDSQLAAALKQSTLEASSGNYSPTMDSGNAAPSQFHTFSNGAESSLPASQHSPYPSYPPSSSPYPQAASGYAPGGPSHMQVNNQRHSSRDPRHKDNPDQKFEDDLQLAMAMSASEAKIEQQRQDIFQSKQLQAMQQYRDRQAGSSSSLPHSSTGQPRQAPVAAGGRSYQEPQATGQQAPWQERISSRLKSFPSGHAPSAPPLRPAISPKSGAAGASHASPPSSSDSLFPSLTGSPQPPHIHSHAPFSAQPATMRNGHANGHASSMRHDLHGPEDPFDLLLDRNQPAHGVSNTLSMDSNAQQMYSNLGIQPAANGSHGAHQNDISSRAGLRSSPSLMDDWPGQPALQPSNSHGEAGFL